MRRQFPALLILLLMLMVPMACGPKPVRIAYQATSVSAAMIDQFNDLVETAWAAKEINRDQLVVAAGISSRWTHAHNAAVTALEISLETGNDSHVVTALKLAARADGLLIQFWELLKGWGLNVPPIELVKMTGGVS